MIDSIARLGEIMRSHGANRLYAKKLAPNDNSKNQVYLGGDFSALNIIPYGTIETDESEVAGSIRERSKAPVTFFWVDGDGRYPAPATQLILYPKYPEIRMSGFLKGARNAPGDVMTVRDAGRVLFLGMTPEGEVLGHAVHHDHPLARELEATEGLKQEGVFLQLPIQPGAADSRTRLLEVLTAIYRRHWIPSQKLSAAGVKEPYSARNGGGYTLEAELGITPNGYAEPDYLGWEIKQYAVRDFDTFRPTSPVTLMTPEPTSGIYRTDGVEAFLRRYGYPDRSGIQNRVNFGGVYRCGGPTHELTGLRMALDGYDQERGSILSMSGGVVLLDRDDNVAAKWGFEGMLEHWKRKHAQAAYVPSLFQTPPPEYRYGPLILLGDGTDFGRLLSAFVGGSVYYDPAVKGENFGLEGQQIKRRSQFRIKHEQLPHMYHNTESVQIAVS